MCGSLRKCRHAKRTLGCEGSTNEVFRRLPPEPDSDSGTAPSAHAVVESNNKYRHACGSSTVGWSTHGFIVNDLIAHNSGIVSPMSRLLSVVERPEEQHWAPQQLHSADSAKWSRRAAKSSVSRSHWSRMPVRSPSTPRKYWSQVPVRITEASLQAPTSNNRVKSPACEPDASVSKLWRQRVGDN